MQHFLLGGMGGLLCGFAVWWLGFKLVSTARGGKVDLNWAWSQIMRYLLCISSIFGLGTVAFTTFIGDGSWASFYGLVTIYLLTVGAYFFYRYGPAKSWLRALP